jgi:hypothetical protein
MASDFKIELADARLRVCAAPLFQSMTDRVGASNYYFHIGPSLRHLGELMGRTGTALRATALVMRFKHMENPSNCRVEASCEPLRGERDALPASGEPLVLACGTISAPKSWLYPSTTFGVGKGAADHIAVPNASRRAGDHGAAGQGADGPPPRGALAQITFRLSHPHRMDVPGRALRFALTPAVGWTLMRPL